MFNPFYILTGIYVGNLSLHYKSCKFKLLLLFFVEGLFLTLTGLNKTTGLDEIVTIDPLKTSEELTGYEGKGMVFFTSTIILDPGFKLFVFSLYYIRVRTVSFVRQ